MTFFLFLMFCVSAYWPLAAEGACQEMATCGECLGFPGDTCIWCSEPSVSVRCQSDTHYLKNVKWCNKIFVTKQESKSSNLIANDPLGSKSGNNTAVQIQPQKMSVKLGPGQEFSFPISFKHAKHFPLDVYYLMDYSETMNRHVQALKSHSEIVRMALTHFTNNVYFGFGSFVDKPAYPFVDNKNSVYVFRHHLNLTSNIKLFSEHLESKKNYTNYDPPNAGLDALMQVMACEKELGWRPNANRIIVLWTDATSHSAGDGKMVLAYKPNDMKCHLNTNGYYDYGLKQDYPSLSQIRKIAKEGKYKIIFAFQGQYNLYRTYFYLAKEVEATSVHFTENSAMVGVIKKSYLKSVKYVTMKYQLPPFVELKLDPDCTKPEKCEMKHDQEFTMKATLKVTSCPKSTLDYHQNLRVSTAEGGLDDKLDISLDILNCLCKCETDGSGVLNATECGNFGTYQCGICKCNDNRSGNKCECNDSEVNSKTKLDECRNTNDTKVCSGRGQCKCGMCTCNDGFSGEYCQFDDNSCLKRNNLLCSGHGNCTLGSCKCESDLWINGDCGCSTLEYNCYAPYSNEKCSGNGNCVCNECVCNKIKDKDETYSGVFCEDCEDCAQKRCSELEDYARCNFLFNKTLCDERHNYTSATDVRMLNKSEINNSHWPKAKWCRTQLDEKRNVVFLHLYDRDQKKLILVLQREEEVMPEANIWISIGIAIGSVILIGIFTLIAWKLIVDALDEREYNRFQKMIDSEDVHIINPHYQPASVDFINPTWSENH